MKYEAPKATPPFSFTLCLHAAEITVAREPRDLLTSKLSISQMVQQIQTPGKRSGNVLQCLSVGTVAAPRLETLSFRILPSI